MQTQRDGLSDLSPPPYLHRRVTSFRTRRTTLTDTQQRTWARLWPELTMTPEQLDRIADHIADFSLSYLNSARRRQRASAKHPSRRK